MRRKLELIEEDHDLTLEEKEERGELKCKLWEFMRREEGERRQKYRPL